MQICIFAFSCGNAKLYEFFFIFERFGHTELKIFNSYLTFLYFKHFNIYIYIRKIQAHTRSLLYYVLLSHTHNYRFTNSTNSKCKIIQTAY
jgi:hypothetical protein